MKNKSLKIRIDRDLDNKINYLLNDKKTNRQNIVMIQT